MPISDLRPNVLDVRFWYTKLGTDESAAVASAIASEHVSQGELTREFERRLADRLGVPYVLLTTSGSVALYLAYASLGVAAGDEIIVPNRTFIATAHAALLLGANVRLVDCCERTTLIDPARIEDAITERTKAIVAVHLNGNPADMTAINDIARRNGLPVVEDAAQAFASRVGDRWLGTFGDIGAFSLGILKMITTGQGGFIAMRDPGLYDTASRLRNHGVADNFWATYAKFGFNFKYNDILAAVGLRQLERLEQKVRQHADVYRWYQTALADIPFVRLLDADLGAGTVPLWIEIVCSERDRVVAEMASRGIQLRPLLRDLSESPHLQNDDRRFINSKRFAHLGVALPCGPDIPLEALRRTATALHDLSDEIAPLRW